MYAYTVKSELGKMLKKTKISLSDIFHFVGGADAPGVDTIFMLMFNRVASMSAPLKRR
jgi:hypothetical protein